MVLKDFLKTLSPRKDRKVKVVITYKEEDFTIFSDAVDLLLDEVKECKIEEWMLLTEQSIRVKLESAIPSG